VRPPRHDAVAPGRRRRPRLVSRRVTRQALVVGGSIAGLLAARVLAEHFTVEVVERDVLPEGPEPRKGVPQARHAHALLRRGAILLESLFPDFGNELRTNGAVDVEVGRTFGFLSPFGWSIHFTPTLGVACCSRDLLESRVRRRVRALPNVRFVEGRSVQRLAAQEGRVTGVELDDGTTRTADLVVDASGRGSKAPQWLTELGFGAPRETLVDGGVGYASRVYEGQLTLPNGWRALTVTWAPPQHKRGGFLVPFEDGRFIATLCGGGGDYPPSDERAFVEFARSLRTPVFQEAMAGARPIGSIHVNRSTVNRFRHFEDLARMPTGFVVVGDAAVAFNPTYGQGMSVAAIEADALRKALAGGSIEPIAFQRTLARAVKDVWLSATGEDFRFVETVGVRPRASRWIHRYMDGVFRLALTDPEVQRLLASVYLLERPLSDLLSPGLALRVLPRTLKGRGSSRNEALAPPA
jgi:2-polyprenyl-6-methoxyphenol hydroxylase-like FAD-dependent oxidoreductase